MSTSATDARLMTRAEAWEAAEVEYRRFEQLIASLGPSDWDAPSPDCPGWTVRSIVSHVVGGCEACASKRALVRQMRGAGRILKDPSWVDTAARSKMEARNNALNELQIRERAHLGPDGLVAAYRDAWPKALRARRRTPRFFDALKMKMPSGPMSMGGLLRIVYTRDTWMHRADICRAIGREMLLTPEHDGRIVADAVADWARSHGRPYELILTGPAGGRFVSGSGGERIEVDAVEFCRITSGRGAGTGLLRTAVVW